MKKIINIIVFAVIVSGAFAQDLTDVKICIDPGHGGHESDDRHILATDFWESEGNLTKAFELDSLLSDLGANVLLTRYGNGDYYPDDPSLSQRVAIANAFDADFFHSIHSNGYNGERNSTLMLFQGFDDGPTFPDAKIMSDIMAVELYNAHRTTHYSVRGDFDFYGTGRAYLGIFKGLGMVGTLSEGSFHDYVPESWRLQNLEYRKHESWAIARSFIDFYSAGDYGVGEIAGVVRDSDDIVPYFFLYNLPKDKYVPINNAKVTLLPDNVEYFTDSMNNGFFLFDSLVPGTYQVITEAAGYPADTNEVVITANKTVFSDVTLVNQTPPYVTQTIPVSNDTAFSILDDIVIDFSREMNSASVESSLVIEPLMEGRYSWKNFNKQLRIIPNSLEMSTNYSITISGEAEDKHGHTLDGNHDGVGGDPFILNFKTNYDVYGPELVEYYPSMNSTNVERRPMIRLEFDELIEPGSVTEDVLKLERFSDRSRVEVNLVFNQINKKHVLHVAPMSDLYPDEVYIMRVFPGLKDKLGNESTKTHSITFVTGNYDYNVTEIDNFNAGIDNWKDPEYSGSTKGIVNLGTEVGAESIIVSPVLDGNGSMRLSYQWDLASAEWMIREYLFGDAPRSVYFDNSYIMQAYVFGDGSGNKFRFAVDDDIYGTAGHEVSLWYTIDWIGWKLISWDMSVDGIGEWIGEDGPLGDGSLDGTLRYDSFQLTYIEGVSDTGTVYFDDLRIVKKVTATSLKGFWDPEFPVSYYIDQNYPNPFNPETEIHFGLPVQERVQIQVYNILGQVVANLLDEIKPAGKYTIRFNGSSLSSGIYLYKIKAGSFVESKKMYLIK